MPSGADAVDRDGRTELHYAALANDHVRVTQLLRGGADPNRADQQGLTALHFAAQERALEAATLLVDAGADPNHVNVHGNSPLLAAVFHSQGEGALITLLRDRGADPYLANRAGQTAVGLARLIGNYPVAQFFDDLPE